MILSQYKDLVNKNIRLANDMKSNIDEAVSNSETFIKFSEVETILSECKL